MLTDLHRKIISTLFNTSYQERDGAYIWIVKVPDVELATLRFDYYPESNMYSFMFDGPSGLQHMRPFTYFPEFFIDDIRSCLLDLCARYMEARAKSLYNVLEYYSMGDFSRETIWGMHEKATKHNAKERNAFSEFVNRLIDRSREMYLQSNMEKSNVD